MAKKKAAKKPKDLDPKSRAKKVKGGRTGLGTQAQRIETRVGRGVQRIGRNVEKTGLATGRAIERAFSPPD
jgi:hypothetical protein